MSLQASERRKVDALRLVRTYQRLFEEDLLARHTGSLLELLRCGLPDDFFVSEEDDTTFIEMEEDAWSHVKLIPHFLKSSQTPSEAEANEEVPDSLEPVQRSHTPDIHTAPALQEIHSSSTSPLSSKPPSSLQAPTLSSRAVTTKMSPQAQPFVLPKQVSRLKSGVPIVQYTGGLVWHLTVLDHPSQMATVEHVLVPMALTAGVISFDAEGVRLGSDGQLTLVQFAVRDVQMGGVCVFIIDVLGLRAGGFEGRLGDFFAGALLQDPKVVKLVHDCHSDAAALAAQHGLQIQAVYDTQVACELLTGVVLGSFSELLCRSGASAHATKRENKALMRKYEGCWARRPLPDQMLQYAADDVRLLLEAGEKLQNMMHPHRGQIMQASAWRAQHAASSGGERRVVFNRIARSALMSYELWCTSKVGPGKSPTDLTPITLLYEWEFTMRILPEYIRNELYKHSSTLHRVRHLILDVGKRPTLVAHDGRRVLMRNANDNGGLVSRETLQYVIARAGGEMAFGTYAASLYEEETFTGTGAYPMKDMSEGMEQRACLTSVYNLDRCTAANRSLERIAVMRNCQGMIYGITFTPGRYVRGCAEMIDDLVLGSPSPSSILVVGPARSGKTSILRELARRLAMCGHDKPTKESSICCIDTHGDLGGDSDIAHPSLVDVRRLMVPSPVLQSRIIEESMKNHTPDCLVVDEVIAVSDVDAVLACHARGSRIICGATGSLARIANDPERCGLVGVKMNTTLPQAQAQGIKASQKLSKASWPVFDVIVELGSDLHNEWTVITKVSQAIDSILCGKPYSAQIRRRDAKTDCISLSFFQTNEEPWPLVNKSLAL